MATVPLFDPSRSRIWATAYADLLNMLQSGGAVDPREFNRELQSINLGTQANVNRLEQMLAARGQSGSAWADALTAATRAGGTEATARAYTRESANRFQRRLAAQNLYYQNVLQPYMTSIANRGRRRASQGQALMQAALTALANYYTYGGYSAYQNTRNQGQSASGYTTGTGNPYTYGSGWV